MFASFFGPVAYVPVICAVVIVCLRRRLCLECYRELRAALQPDDSKAAHLDSARESNVVKFQQRAS